MVSDEQHTPPTIGETLDLIKRRRSSRHYRPEPVSDEMVHNILEAGRWAPSGSSSEPWELIVIRDPARRAQLAEYLIDTRKPSEVAEEAEAGQDAFPFPDMSYLRDASVFIAVVGDRRLIRTYPELYYRNNIYQQSVAACMQNMWLAATAQGLGGTWLSMGRLIEKPIEELLDVPSPDYRIDFILAVGWSDNVREDRERRPLDEIVHYERFDHSKIRAEEAWRAVRARRREDRELSGETPTHLGYDDDE